MVPSLSIVAAAPDILATFCARTLRWSISSFAERPEARASRISSLSTAIWSAVAFTCETVRSAESRALVHCVATLRYPPAMWEASSFADSRMLDAAAPESGVFARSCQPDQNFDSRAASPFAVG